MTTEQVKSRCYDCLSEDVAVKIIDLYGFEHWFCAEDWAHWQRFHEGVMEMLQDAQDCGNAQAESEGRIYACDCTCHDSAAEATECPGGCHEFYGRRLHGRGEVECYAEWCKLCDRDPCPIPHGPEFQTGEPLL